MKPTEILTTEHRAIQQMLEILTTAAEKYQAGELDDLTVFERAVDFFRGFADRCHHGKEERLLFKRLVARGVPEDGGPIGVMLAEHEAGRSHVRGLAKAVKRLRAGENQDEAATALVEHALAYADLLSNHIHKEDNVLFPLADRVLEPADQAELAEAFERVEAEEMGEGVHERYHQVLETLSRDVMDPGIR